MLMGHKLPPIRMPEVVNKYLEMSNVNLMEELVTSIEDQRVFEINLKLVKAAEDIDRGGSSLMRMPS